MLRRDALLKTAAAGFGYLAFAGLSTWAAEKGATRWPRSSRTSPRGPSTSSSCAWKAARRTSTPSTTSRSCQRLDGKTHAAGARAFAKLLASPWKFNQHGQSGLWISELFPELAKQADELCLLRGMHTDVPAHPQAFLQMHTGIFQFKRPSMGAWTLLRPGHREREPARLRHHQPAAAERRPGQLRQRLPAGRLPGHADRSGFGGGPAAAGSGRRRRPAAASATSATRASRPRPSGRSSTSSSRSTASAGPRAAQPGRRGRHRVVRAGLPHAEGPAEADGPRRANRRRRSRSTASASTATDELRPAMPAGPALRRGGRALRRGHLRPVGPPPRPEEPALGEQGRRASISRSPACCRT